MVRKFKRDVLRKQVGNKGLSSIWETLQRKKYGDDYLFVCRSGRNGR